MYSHSECEHVANISIDRFSFIPPVSDQTGQAGMRCFCLEGELASAATDSGSKVS